MALFFRSRFVFLSRVALLGLSSAATRAQEVSKPSLVVVISIDQMRADYLTRFAHHYEGGGFKRLIEQGANFSECHYRHSHTKTACGHSVMLTGVHADVHGIIGNDWVDRNTFKSVGCVQDSGVRVLGARVTSAVRVHPLLGGAAPGASPKNLLAKTVGDQLKAASPQSKVIGISNKDRSAILMTGRKADAAYFMENGRMVSSTFYFSELPAWVTAWNERELLDTYFGKTWERLLPEEAYAIQGPDDAPGEDVDNGKLGNTLPKLITAGEKVPNDRFRSAARNTPFMNEVLIDFVYAALEQEKLGQRDVTDILCVSFSANDYIGHLYGPDSHEIMDNMVRMDRILAEFFDRLDQHVGLANCTIVLTADHGVAPMPERMAVDRPGVPAGRSFAKEVTTAAEDALNAAFGSLADGSAWLLRDDTSFLIHPSALKEKKLTAEAVQLVVRDALAKVHLVEAAYTRAQLERGEVTGDLGVMALRSFNRERSGDVYFQVKPYFFHKTTGTTHGAPYDYDTHVPLVWFGVGVKPGAYAQRVGVDDLAPTLAHLLGLPAPQKGEGKTLF